MKFTLLFNFLLLILLSGCVSTNVKPIDITYSYVSCGKLDRNMQLEMEDLKQHAGSKENQEIYTRNLITISNKLKQSFVIIDCYEKQVKYDN